MAKTIADLRTELNDALDAIAITYGENTVLNTADQNEVSYGVDARNETWNDTLGTRPH